MKTYKELSEELSIVSENDYSKLTQNQIEHIKDLVQRGIITTAQANVEKVKMARVQVVQGSLPAPVRKALNDAVKNKELKRFPKQGLMPEVYYHPSFEHLAKAARIEIAQRSTNSLSKVFGSGK